MQPEVQNKQSLLRRLLFLFLSLTVAASAFYFVAGARLYACWSIRSLLEASENETARNQALAAVEEFSDSGECHFLLAKSNRHLGRLNEATESLAFAESLGWDPEDIEFERVLTIAQSGRFREVDARLQQIFKRDLSSFETLETYEAMAWGRRAAFDIPEFRRCIEFWIDWAPNDPAPHLMLADLFLQLGDYASALKEYSEALKLQPGNLPALAGRGQCLLELNRAMEALFDLQKVFEQKQTAEAACTLAKCYVSLGQTDNARALLMGHLSAEDTEIRARIEEELGRVYLYENQGEEAVRYLKKAVSTAPESASAWHALSSAYGLEGNPDAAAEALQTSRDIRARSDRLGEIVQKLASESQSVDLRMEAVDILLQQGMKQDALAWLRTVLQQDPGHLLCHRMLASIYSDMGFDEQAEVHRRRASELSGDTE